MAGNTTISEKPSVCDKHEDLSEGYPLWYSDTSAADTVAAFMRSAPMRAEGSSTGKHSPSKMDKRTEAEKTIAFQITATFTVNLDKVRREIQATDSKESKLILDDTTTIARAVQNLSKNSLQVDTRVVRSSAPGEKDTVAWESLYDKNAPQPPDPAVAVSVGDGDGDTMLTFAQTKYISWSTVEWVAEWADKIWRKRSIVGSPRALFADKLLDIVHAHVRGLQRWAFRVSELFGVNDAARGVDDIAVNRLVVSKGLRSLDAYIPAPNLRTQGVTVTTTPALYRSGGVLWVGFNEHVSSLVLPTDNGGGILVSSGPYAGAMAMACIDRVPYSVPGPHASRCTGDHAQRPIVRCLECIGTAANRVIAGGRDVFNTRPTPMSLVS